jgi:uncharacterized protein YggU (UPF0235/DUF167 family)
VRSFDGLAVAIHAFPNGVERALTGKANDALVPVIDEVLRGRDCAFVIVGHHGRNRRIHYRPIDCDDRHGNPFEQVAQSVTLRIGRDNDQSINAVTDQHVQIVQLITWVVGGNCDDEQRVIGARNRLGSFRAA